MQTPIVMPTAPRPDHPVAVEPTVRTGPARQPHESFGDALASLQKKAGTAALPPAAGEAASDGNGSDGTPLRDVADTDEAVDRDTPEATDPVIDSVMDTAFFSVVPVITLPVAKMSDLVWPATMNKVDVDVAATVAGAHESAILELRGPAGPSGGEADIAEHAHVNQVARVLMPVTASPSVVGMAVNVPTGAVGDLPPPIAPITTSEELLRFRAADAAILSGDDAASVTRALADVKPGALINRITVTGLDGKDPHSPRGDRGGVARNRIAAPLVSPRVGADGASGSQSYLIGGGSVVVSADKMAPFGISDGIVAVAGSQTPLLSMAPAGTDRLAGQAPSDTANRPQTPLLAQHVAQQLSVSLYRQAGGTMELALDPVELGRVRMTVTAHDQTITMVVMADRPETADLMRRHVDVLQQEFRGLGYTSVNLAFGSGQDRPAAGSRDGSDPGVGQSDPAFGDEPSAIAATADAATRADDGSLDLRL